MGLKVKQMKLTPAEKQRLYRQRRNANPEKRAAYLLKEKKKYVEDVISGKRKLIKYMSEREQRKTRKD